MIVRDASGAILPGGDSRIDIAPATPLATLGNLVIGDNASSNRDAWYVNDWFPPHPRSADGDIDEVQIYTGIPADTDLANIAAFRHDCAGADHFEIAHAGTGVTCEPAAITLRAHAADHSVFAG